MNQSNRPHRQGDPFVENVTDLLRGDSARPSPWSFPGGDSADGVSGYFPQKNPIPGLPPRHALTAVIASLEFTRAVSGLTLRYPLADVTAVHLVEMQDEDA